MLSGKAMSTPTRVYRLQGRCFLSYQPNSLLNISAAIFVLDEPTRSARAAGRLAALAARLRAPRLASARITHWSACSHGLLSSLSERVGVSCGLVVWSARVPRRSIRLMRFALSDNP